MAEMHYNDSAALTDVYFNGTQLDKVYYNNTLVFEKVKTTAETIAFGYYATPGPSVYFYFGNTQTYYLANSPKKVISITGGLGGTDKTIWTVTSDLSGTVKTPADANTASGYGSNYKTFNWSISGNKLTIATSDSTTSSHSTVDVTITYQY